MRRTLIRHSTKLTLLVFMHHLVNTQYHNNKDYNTVFTSIIEHIPHETDIKNWMHCTLLFRCESGGLCPMQIHMKIKHLYLLTIIYTMNTTTDLKFSMVYPKHQQVCSIAIYAVIKHDEATIAKSWLQSIPGGYTQNYHILFVCNSLTEDAKYKPDSSASVLMLMAHKVFVTWKNEKQYYEVSETNILGHVTQKMKILAGNSNDLPAKPLKWNNFNGEAIIFPLSKQGSFTTKETVELYKKSKSSPYFHVADIVEIAISLNATPTLIITPHSKHGTRMAQNGQWNGVLNALVHGNAHLSTQVTVTQNRSDVVDFSQICQYEKFIFVTAKPKTFASSVLFVFKSFPGLMWIAYGISRIAMFAGLCFFGKIYLHEYWDIILCPIVDQPIFINKTLEKVVLKWKIKILLASWLLSEVITVTLLKSSTITLLLTPMIEFPPETFHELAVSSYIIQTFGVKGFSEQEIMDKMKNIPIVQTVSNRLEEVSNYQECFADTQRGRFACAATTKSMKMGTRIFLVDENGEKHFQLSKDHLFTTFLSVAISKHFQQLKDPVNKILAQMVESGIYDFWEQDTARVFSTGYYSQFRLKSEKLQLKVNVLKIESFYSILLLLVSGLGISCVTLVVELIRFKLGKYRNKVSIFKLKFQLLW